MDRSLSRDLNRPMASLCAAEELLFFSPNGRTSERAVVVGAMRPGPTAAPTAERKLINAAG